MKEYYIGYKYSFYENPEERKIILKKTDVYENCKENKIKQLQDK